MATKGLTMTAPEPPQFVSLVGRTVIYCGCQYKIVDYVKTDQSLILRSLKTEASIQMNQFGNANRRVQQTISIPVFTDSEQVLPEIIAWLEHS